MSQAYIDSWVKVCEEYPELTFYYYTKSKCNLSVLENLENIVSNSSIYQKRKNYGDDAYCQNLYDFISLDEHYRVKICPCDPDEKLPDGEANKICGKSCTFCQEKVEGKQNFTIFRGHGKAFEEAKKKRKKEKKNKKKKAA